MAGVNNEITTIISNLTFLADSIVTGGAENATLDNDDRNVTTDGGDTNSSLDAEQPTSAAAAFAVPLLSIVGSLLAWYMATHCVI